MLTIINNCLNSCQQENRFASGTVTTCSYDDSRQKNYNVISRV